MALASHDILAHVERNKTIWDCLEQKAQTLWDRFVFDFRKHVAEISECQTAAVQVLDDILCQVETRFIIVGVARALNARNPVSL